MLFSGLHRKTSPENSLKLERWQGQPHIIKQKQFIHTSNGTVEHIEQLNETSLPTIWDLQYSFSLVIQLSSSVYFQFRKEPPDPNAPLPPLPLHLHPPPLLKRPSLDGKKERSGSDEFSWEAACCHGLGYFEKRKKKKQPLIWFDIFFSSALNPCVVCHSRKESSDSKPPSLKKTSDHVKKDRSGIWELFCFSFVLEKNALLLSLEDQWPQTLISVFCLFYTKYWHSILSVHDSNVVFRAVM